MRYPLNTLLFLSEIRKAMCEYYEELGTTDDVKNYITNEASDHEIISVLATDEWPNEKLNEQEELANWRVFQEFVVQEFADFHEVLEIDQGVMNEVIFEMGPVSHLSLSSAKPILEHHVQSGYLQDLTEKEYDAFQFNKKEKEYPIPTISPKQQKEVDKTHAAKMAAKKEAAKSKTRKGAEAFGKGMQADVKSGYESLKKGTKNRTDAIKAVTKGTATSDQQTTAAKTAGAAGKAALVVGAAGLAAYGAKKLYGRYFSAAAKQCKGLSGGDRSACIAKAKAKASAAAKSKAKRK